MHKSTTNANVSKQNKPTKNAAQWSLGLFGGGPSFTGMTTTC